MSCIHNKICAENGATPPREILINWADRIYWYHLGLLALGALAGIIVAYYFSLIPFSFPSLIAKSRSIGIVSVNVLQNHAELENIIQYLSVLGFPVVGGLGVWWLWARNCRPEIELLFASLDGQEAKSVRSKRVLLMLLIPIYFYLFFNINLLYMTNYGWQFLGEEGETLACVNRILLGDVYGKDFASIYGPLMIYPLALCMKLFGVTVTVQRGYTLFLNVLAHALVVSFLWKGIKSRAVFFISCLIYFSVFHLSRYASPNTTYLRCSLGVYSIGLCSLYIDCNRRYILIITGIIEGLLLLFSQEIAICSFVSILVMLFLKTYNKNGWVEMIREMLLFFTSIFATILPFLIYFITNNALMPAFHMLLTYPKLFSIGFNCLPFIDFNKFINNPLGQSTLFPYWIIFIYIISALAFIPRLLSKNIKRSSILRIGILIFGMILFRSALGRCDMYHVLFVSPPAFILTMFMADDLMNQNKVGLNFGRTFVTILIIISFIPLLTRTIAGDVLLTEYKDMTLQNKRFSIAESGIFAHKITRGKIFYAANQYKDINKIGYFLDLYTKENDYVYFFPNEATYYFLFNRREPTRYNVSYLAATFQQRQELLNDLDKNKPEYVVYSLDTWRVDNISENIQEPEVVKYLRQKYNTFKNMGNILILKRRQ